MAKWSICVLLFSILECQCMICPNTGQQQATPKSFKSALKQMQRQIKYYKKALRPFEKYNKVQRVRQDDFKDIACSFTFLTESLHWTLAAKEKNSSTHTEVIRQLSDASCDVFREYRNLTGVKICGNTINNTETTDAGLLLNREVGTLCKLDYFISCLWQNSKGSSDFFKSTKLICKRKSKKCGKKRKSSKKEKKKGSKKRKRKNKKRKRCKNKKKNKGKKDGEINDEDENDQGKKRKNKCKKEKKQKKTKKPKKPKKPKKTKKPKNQKKPKHEENEHDQIDILADMCNM